MEKLEKKIDETLRNNIEVELLEGNDAIIDDESLKVCANILAQEEKDRSIAFAKKINGHSLTFTNMEKEYNKFIDNYYK